MADEDEFEQGSENLWADVGRADADERYAEAQRLREERQGIEIRNAAEHAQLALDRLAATFRAAGAADVRVRARCESVPVENPPLVWEYATEPGSTGVVEPVEVEHLEDLLGRITPENLHGEQLGDVSVRRDSSSGPPIGWRPLVAIARKAAAAEGASLTMKEPEGTLCFMGAGSPHFVELCDLLDQLADRLDPGTGAARPAV